MKTIALLVGLIFAFQISAQTTTRHDGLLYRLYEQGEETPFAEVFGYALEDNAHASIPDSIIKDDMVYPVTRIADYAFNNCKEIVSVTIGKNIKSISEGAFNECSNLQSVQMSDSIHSIGAYAFDRCTQLKKIVLSESLDYILFSAFSNSGLTELKLPQSLKIVAKYAFGNCHNLQSITINSELRIDREAFTGCESISAIFYNSPVLKQSDKNIFDNDIYKTATLFVPSDCVQAAYDTEPWLYFVHIKEIDLASINDVKVDDIAIESTIEIFNLNGVKHHENLDNLAPGFYIIRKGNTIKKIIVK